MALVGLGELKEAERIFSYVKKTFIDSDSAMATACHNLAWLEDVREFFNPSDRCLRKQVRLLRRALALDSRRANSRASLVLGLMLLGQKTDALKLLNEALRCEEFMSALRYELTTHGRLGFCILQQLPEYLIDMIFQASRNVFWNNNPSQLRAAWRKGTDMNKRFTLKAVFSIPLMAFAVLFACELRAAAQSLPAASAGQCNCSERPTAERTEAKVTAVTRQAVLLQVGLLQDEATGRSFARSEDLSAKVSVTPTGSPLLPFWRPSQPSSRIPFSLTSGKWGQLSFKKIVPKLSLASGQWG